MTTLYGGIDIGLKDFQFQAMDRDGNIVGKTKRFPNNVPGTEQLVDYIDEQFHQHDFTSVSLGMEASGLY